MDPDSAQPKFLEYVKNNMLRENNNYLAVMFKTCIENSFDDKIKQGKSKPYAAKPPVASYEEIREKLILSNLEKQNFDADELLEQTFDKLNLSFKEIFQALVEKLKSERQSELLKQNENRHDQREEPSTPDAGAYDWEE